MTLEMIICVKSIKFDFFRKYFILLLLLFFLEDYYYYYFITSLIVSFDITLIQTFQKSSSLKKIFDVNRT